MNQCNSV